MLPSPLDILRDAFAAGIARAFPDLTPPAGGGAHDPLVAASKNPQHGDYQCNAAMALGKLVGRPPREVAKALVAAVDVSAIAEPLTEGSIAGPGFINIRLRGAALGELLARLGAHDLGLAPSDEVRRTSVVVDLCGVNLAKQMHVGHLRSTVIGDTVARTLERLGYRVVRQNHVGDWGLPIAMVIAALIEEHGPGDPAGYLHSLDQLDAAYKRAQARCRVDEALVEALAHARSPKLEAEWGDEIEAARRAGDYLLSAKRTLVALQAKEPTAYAVWQRIYRVTMNECLRVCAALNADVRDEHSAGESSYAGELAEAVEDVLARGVAEVSQGAVVIRVPGIAEPCLIRKSDGGYLYATTDLCAIRRRVRELGAARVVYCVDARQGLHFKQVFEAAKMAGYARRVGGGAEGAAADATLEHAAFGTILGEDGRPFKTRSGENVRLTALLDEAHERALAAALQRTPDLAATDREAVAHAVAVAAIRYTDLSTERIKDYVFSFDRMLAFEGNTGPYLLYALVRIRSIFRKASERGIDAAHEARGALRIEAPAERALAITLLRYPQVMRDAGATAEPHRLCAYAYELAGAFASFFDQCPVLGAATPDERGARLALCRLTERVLGDALSVLGIPLVDRM